MTCTCTNEQLYWVGCECEAECNTGTGELARRESIQAAKDAAAEEDAIAEYYRREQAAKDAEAAHHLAQLKAQERADRAESFDWDGYNNRCIEQFGLFPA